VAYVDRPCSTYLVTRAGALTQNVCGPAWDNAIIQSPLLEVHCGLARRL
jgi:hypothetical protein